MGNDTALLNVQVPDHARVTVNGAPTRSTGSLRQYVSQDLASGFRYSYQIRAEAEVNGRTVAQTKTVRLRAGDTANLAFKMHEPTSQETSLTLHVPEDAKIFLAGSEVPGNGQVRTFRTTKLDTGKRWSQYKVRVVINHNGTDVSKEETISLRAGEQREMTFDFDIDKIASIR